MIEPLNRRKFLTLSTAAAASGILGRTFADDPYVPFPGPPTQGPTVKSAVANGTNQFGTELYKLIKKDQDNVFFSPYSISTALAMTAAGAKGETLTEFQKTLHFPAEMKATHDGFTDLMTRINGTESDKRSYQLSTANALWAQKGYPWTDEFTGLTRKNYRAYIESVDYGQPEVARQTINKWVELQTKDKIKELIAKGLITKDTRLVLTNAIYFKAEWLSKFEKTYTKEATFTTDAGKKMQVPLMLQVKRFAYGEQDDLQVVELPYKGGELSMVLMLPAKPDGLAKIEDNISATNLLKWTIGLKPQLVSVSIPKFKVETSYQLKEPLQTLGLKKAFGVADFSAMTTSGEPFFISEVVHKAYVDVDETGTEAAAATAVLMMGTGAPAQPKVFRADRPFLFAIRHIATGSVLFMGRVTNPSK